MGNAPGKVASPSVMGSVVAPLVFVPPSHFVLTPNTIVCAAGLARTCWTSLEPISYEVAELARGERARDRVIARLSSPRARATVAGNRRAAVATQRSLALALALTGCLSVDDVNSQSPVGETSEPLAACSDTSISVQLRAVIPQTLCSISDGPDDSRCSNGTCCPAGNWCGTSDQCCSGCAPGCPC